MTFRAVPLAEDLLQLRATGCAWPSPCNVYLLRAGAGAALFDTGLGAGEPYAALVSSLAAALGTWELALADIHSIVLTHTHADHAGAAVPLQRLTGATLHVPAQGWAQACDPWWQVHHILPEEVRVELASPARDFDIAAHFQEQCMPELLCGAKPATTRFVHAGERLTLGAWSFEVHRTPGHDIGQLLYYEPRRGVALTGDLLAAGGTALPWYPPNAGGVEAYLASLDAAGALPIELACPGHGPALHGLETVRAGVRRTSAIILGRDSVILERLQEAARPFHELDDAIYPGKVRDVIPWASSVTWTHVKRLERLGLLGRRADGEFCRPAGSRAWPAL